MSDQSNSAAERSAHVTRGEKPAPAEWPVVRMPDGAWKLKSVMALEARIAELEAALATARRDAMEEAARKVEIMWLMWREKDNGASDWIFRAHDDIPTGDDFATAIRALGREK